MLLISLVFDQEIYLNDYDSFTIKSPTSFLSYTPKSNVTTDTNLIVTVPANGTGFERTDSITIEYKKNGVLSKTENVIVIQTAL